MSPAKFVPAADFADVDLDDDDDLLDEEPQAHEIAADPTQRCRYPSKHCERRRALKRTGAPHSMCAFHRAKANRNQRRLERRKRVLRDEARLRGTHLRTLTPAASPADATYSTQQRLLAMHRASAMVMLPTIDAASASSVAMRYSSPRDVDISVGFLAHLEPFRTPVPLFKEDLEELSALVDVSVTGLHVSFACAHEEHSQSRIV